MTGDSDALELITDLRQQVERIAEAVEALGHEVERLAAGAPASAADASFAAQTARRVKEQLEG
jgi:outer membrane murein-binding lipoprotein Lpp